LTCFLPVARLDAPLRALTVVFDYDEFKVNKLDLLLVPDVFFYVF